MSLKKWLVAALCLASPSLYAHEGHVDHGLISGLLHPLTGIDHLLVLIAVGFIAAKQGGKALLIYPMFFLVFMAIGATLNAYAVHISFLETLIALSLVAFGLLLNLNHKKYSKMFLLSISFFAIFHGYAHAAEIPANASLVLYFSELMLMSLFICLGGILIELSTGKRINFLLSLICLSSGWYYLAVN